MDRRLRLSTGQQSWLMRIALAFGVALIIIVFTQESILRLGILQRLELASVDYRFQYRGVNQGIRDSAHVVIVEINEESFRSLHEQFPWPRSFYAHLLRNLKAATFHFEAGSSEADTRALLERRKQTQPIGEWSCGSVFTNPPGDHAARLIEAAGLKGLRIGGAVVSTKHAIFILNEGEATARDIETLIRQVQQQVASRHGCMLTPECRIVGDAA